MPSKKRKVLSQAEIWDDSALIQSWDEALQEYQHYHSIHARGEKVEEVLAAEDEARMDPHSSRTTPDGAHAVQPPPHGRADAARVEAADEEIEEPLIVPNAVLATTEEARVQAEPQREAALQSGGAVRGAERAGAGPLHMPNGLIGAGDDEALKGLMMSWYYAGYYTGLHDGLQRSKRDAEGGG